MKYKRKETFFLSLASENDAGESMFLSFRFKTSLSTILSFPWFYDHVCAFMITFGSHLWRMHYLCRILCKVTLLLKNSLSANESKFYNKAV